jgi:DHA2 family multidrug resistance protein-like MFS transporter
MPSAEISSSVVSLPDGLPVPRRHWAVATLMVVLTLASLDSTMVNVALPAMSKDLNVTPSLVMWVVIANSLAIVVSLLPFTAVAGRIGFRRMLAAGLTVFMLGAVACALAGSFFALLAARVFQGFGSSMLMCLIGGLVRNIYPIRKMGFGISLSALMVAVMAVLGPTIGAFILDVSSWPWLFALYVPLCLVAHLGVRFMPDVPVSKSRFDWWACALSVMVFGLFITGLDMLVSAPWVALACMVVAAPCTVALVRRSQGPTPLVPVDLLRITPVAYAVAASCCSFASAMAAFVALPFYFLNVLSYSYAETGLLLGAWSVGVAVMAPVAGHLADRYQVSVLCAIGAVCMTLALIWVAVLPLDAGFGWVGVTMLLGGVGFGFFQSPNNRAMLVGAPRRRSGAAGGLQATTRVFGQSLGTALAAVAFHVSVADGAVLGLVVAILCSLGALIINIARYFSPVPDLEI